MEEYELRKIPPPADVEPAELRRSSPELPKSNLRLGLCDINVILTPGQREARTRDLAKIASRRNIPIPEIILD